MCHLLPVPKVQNPGSTVLFCVLRILFYEARLKWLTLKCGHGCPIYRIHCRHFHSRRQSQFLVCFDSVNFGHDQALHYKSKGDRWGNRSCHVCRRDKTVLNQYQIRQTVLHTTCLWFSLTTVILVHTSESGKLCAATCSKYVKLILEKVS